MDPVLALVVLAFAGALILPAALLVRWLEIRAEHRRGTPAE
jgi:hypothetical protein